MVSVIENQIIYLENLNWLVPAIGFRFTVIAGFFAKIAALQVSALVALSAE